VLHALAAHSLAPQQLCIEVTEDALHCDDGIATTALECLREAGVAVHLDDFGVAYSSFGRLAELPVDVLKLDRIFVQHIDKDDRKRALAASILHVSQTMALGLIAEGVETEAEADVLRGCGYKVAQGFLFARPMPADEFAAFARF
jgi:cyclic di-GMP phosphodiesterase Gmr